ncbi:hypothetical protein AYI70_g11694 [Smittium culicis]|uniref:Uncharacterized protein n=1 Tax=Smittium culicis TaxID=133412 RepID=A0A1R1X0S1_9FUNG|nr:hypothetical protein AYI70_g11694 [Smittium culicis]
MYQSTPPFTDLTKDDNEPMKPNVIYVKSMIGELNTNKLKDFIIKEKSLTEAYIHPISLQSCFVSWKIEELGNSDVIAALINSNSNNAWYAVKYDEYVSST